MLIDDGRGAAPSDIIIHFGKQEGRAMEVGGAGPSPTAGGGGGRASTAGASRGGDSTNKNTPTLWSQRIRTTEGIRSQMRDDAMAAAVLRPEQEKEEDISDDFGQYHRSSVASRRRQSVFDRSMSMSMSRSMSLQSDAPTSTPDQTAGGVTPPKGATLAHLQTKHRTRGGRRGSPSRRGPPLPHRAALRFAAEHLKRKREEEMAALSLLSGSPSLRESLGGAGTPIPSSISPTNAAGTRSGQSPPPKSPPRSTTAPLTRPTTATTTPTTPRTYTRPIYPDPLAHVGPSTSPSRRATTPGSRGQSDEGHPTTHTYMDTSSGAVFQSVQRELSTIAEQSKRKLNKAERNKRLNSSDYISTLRNMTVPSSAFPTMPELRATIKEGEAEIAKQAFATPVRSGKKKLKPHGESPPTTTTTSPTPRQLSLTSESVGSPAVGSPTTFDGGAQQQGALPRSTTTSATTTAADVQKARRRKALLSRGAAGISAPVVALARRRNNSQRDRFHLLHPDPPETIKQQLGAMEADFIQRDVTETSDDFLRGETIYKTVELEQRRQRRRLPVAGGGAATTAQAVAESNRVRRSLWNFTGGAKMNFICPPSVTLGSDAAATNGTGVSDRDAGIEPDMSQAEQQQRRLIAAGALQMGGTVMDYHPIFRSRTFEE